MSAPCADIHDAKRCRLAASLASAVAVAALPTALFAASAYATGGLLPISSAAAAAAAAAAAGSGPYGKWLP